MENEFVVKPILDTKTGTVYPSEYQAGKAHYQLVGGDVRDNFVWFKIRRRFGSRFRTKNRSGQWVPLDDPDVPQGKLRNH